MLGIPSCWEGAHGLEPAQACCSLQCSFCCRSVLALCWAEPGEPPHGGQARAGGHLSSFHDVHSERWHKRLIHPAERRVCTRAPVPLHRDQLSCLCGHPCLLVCAFTFAGICQHTLALAAGVAGPVQGQARAQCGPHLCPRPQHRCDAAAWQMPLG